MTSREHLLLALAWLLFGVALVTTPAGLSVLDGVANDLETLLGLLPRPNGPTRETQDIVPPTRIQNVLAFSVVGIFVGIGIFAFVARGIYHTSWQTFIRAFRNVIEADRQPRSRRTLADEIAIQYERSMSRSALVLLLALALAVLAAWAYPGRAILSGALLVSMLFLAASLRHFLLKYRIEHGLFGSAEHEVRALLEFVLEQPDTGEFTNGGGPKVAFVAAVRNDAAPVGLAEGSDA